MLLAGLEAGVHYVPSDPRDDKGRFLANGLYLVAVESAGRRAIGRLLIQR